MNNNNNRYNEIIQDEIILGIFIFLNVLNFYADEVEKECLVSRNRNLLRYSKDIIIFTLMITLLIYIYFAVNNYKDMINNQDSPNGYIFNVRYIGSILVVLGLGCLLYFRIKTRGGQDIDLSEGL